MKPDPTLFLDIINAEAEENRLFWVAGLASEVHAILYPIRDQLHPVARQAVEHYHEEAKSS
jgi:hypothetical protein